MNIAARAAVAEDLPDLLRMYRGLEAEMIPLEPNWPQADGIPSREHPSFEALLAADGVSVLVGEIEGVPLGFLVGIREAVGPPGGGTEIGSVRYIFTEADAREVGIAEAMLEAFVASERAEGVRLFDAHVTPGHRLTKNFFESKGFSARSIVMHRDDARRASGPR